MSKHSQDIAKGAISFGAATFLSRLLGFVRDSIIGHILGASAMADAFFIAFRIPNLLRSLFAEGSLTMAFVPVFTRKMQDEGKEKAFPIARAVQLWVLLLLGMVTTLVMIYPDVLVRFIAPGFTKDAQLFAFTTVLTRICFPYILFISAVAICMGILNSMRHFWTPALAPCVLNITQICTGLLAYHMGWSVPLALSFGVLIAGFGQWLLQQPALHSRGFTWIGPVKMVTPEVKKIGRLMLPTVLGAAVYQLNIMISSMLASTLPKGSISYLYYADRLMQFPLGVFGVAISSVALPSLVALTAPSRKKEFNQTVSSSLKLTLLISIPAAVGLAGLAYPLVKILFGHGEFSHNAVIATSLALIAYSFGLPAIAAVRTLVSSFYVKEDMKTPVISSIISVIVNICVGYYLMQYYQHIGLAIAMSISAWVNVIILLCCLVKRQGFEIFNKFGDVLRMIMASVFLYAGIYFTASWGFWALLCIPIWGILYFYLVCRLKVYEGQMLVGVVFEKFKRKLKV